MEKHMRKLRTTIVLCVCVIMFFNNTVFDTGHTSYAATKLDLKLTLNSDGSIKSTWSKITDAKYYTLLLVDPAPIKCCAIEKNLVKTTYTSKDNLKANVKYSVVVAAYNKEGTCITSELGKILIPIDFYEKDVPESSDSNE